ncbi:MAG: DUF4091 domain-containing protein [Defluviitaleaceae bacterium]|nr:DUF4091 domain-containing protein [Defluviitaleaceae bacterium]
MLELRLLSSLAKVFPRSAPAQRPEASWLSALQGETISFQAAYKQGEQARRAWANLEIISPKEVDVQVRRTRYIPGYISTNFRTDDSYLKTEDSLYPDLLEPIDTKYLPLVPGTWQSMWIDIIVPATASPGRYPISVTIKSPCGEVLGSGETSFEVLPVMLPPLSIPRTMWFHTDCLAEYYNVEVFSEKHWEIVENFVACAVNHGMNTILTPIHTPPLDTEIGRERLTTQLIDVTFIADGATYEFGFEKLERWVNMCRRVGVEYYEMAHLFTQWGAKFAPKIMGTKDGKYTRLFGWDTSATGPGYTSYLQQMLPALIAKLEAWGIAEKTFFHISDEPVLDQLPDYMAARKVVEPLLKGYKIMDALSNYEFYQQGACATPIPAVDHLGPFLEGNADDLWAYYCCSQSYKVPNHFFMHPSYRNRVLGVLLYKYNIKGFLHWGFNFYKSVGSVYPVDPFLVTDADGAFPSGDAYVVYPGPEGKPLASLRLMVAQEAFNDFRALQLLEKLAGRETVLGLIDEGLNTPINFSEYPQNEEYLLNLRLRVNQLIGELSC